MQFQKHLRLRNADGDPANPDNPGSGGAGAPAEPAKPEIAARPEGFPEDYWDAEKGAVKFDALTPKLQELALKPAGVAKPEEIDWTLPADIDPDSKDTVYEINKDDPLVQSLAPVMVGLPQNKITELTTAFARFQINELKATREAIKAEEQKLGEKYQERVAGAQAFIEKVVGKEKAARFRNTWTTAEQVEVVEALAKYAGGPEAAKGENGAGNQESKGRTFYSGMSGGATN